MSDPKYTGKWDGPWRTPARAYSAPKFLRGLTPKVTAANGPSDPGFGLSDSAASIRGLLRNYLCTTDADRKAVTVAMVPWTPETRAQCTEGRIASARYRVTVPASWHHHALDLLGEWGFVATAAGWAERRQHDDDIFLLIHKIRD